MSSSKTPRSSRRILVMAPAGMLGALAVPGAQAASVMPLGSFETYKPVPFAGSAPWGIAAGPDGAMWFTEFQREKIGRITMKGDISEFSTPSAARCPSRDRGRH